MNKIKPLLKDVFQLYEYKVALLFSLTFVPLIVAAISNNIPLSYSIGIASFVLFIVVQNAKLLSKWLYYRRAHQLKLQYQKALAEISAMEINRKDLKMQVDSKVDQLDYYVKSLEIIKEIEISNVKEIRPLEKKKIVTDLLMLLHSYEDSISRRQHIIDSLKNFYQDEITSSQSEFKLQFYSEVIDKIISETKLLEYNKDVFKKYIDEYLKEFR